MNGLVKNAREAINHQHEQWIFCYVRLSTYYCNKKNKVVLDSSNKYQTNSSREVPTWVVDVYPEMTFELRFKKKSFSLYPQNVIKQSINLKK